ncbi:MAG TPA: type II toxin-antitoxin system prevent-host-death family antitoxin [Rhizomicrobium sp.]|nr:type II toxin-antitoxin system prevent-host-death family antitoxin [Rhizomicrobium sp.]
MEKTVNINTAKAHLASLIAEAEAGEDIVIARAGKPAVKLVPVKRKAQKEKKSKLRLDRKPGFMKGQIHILKGFYDPLPDHILAAFRGEND